MNIWTSAAGLLVLLTTLACRGGAPAPPPSQPAPAPAPVAEPAPQSEAIARADALLADFTRREAAQAKFDRENPPTAVIPIPRPVRAASNASDTAMLQTTAPGVAAATATVPARDETWWKQQMRALQLALDEELVKLAAAEKANMKYGYNDAQSEYKRRLDAVANARLAIERLHDEARRAGVPPGWLRWP